MSQGQVCVRLNYKFWRHRWLVPWYRFGGSGVVLQVKLSLSVIGNKWLSSAMCEIGVEVGCNFVEVDDIFGPVSGHLSLYY